MHASQLHGCGKRFCVWRGGHVHRYLSSQNVTMQARDAMGINTGMPPEKNITTNNRLRIVA